MGNFKRPKGLKKPAFTDLKYAVKEAKKVADKANKALERAEKNLYNAEDSFNHTLEGAYLCGHGVYGGKGSINQCVYCGSVRDIHNGAMYFNGIQVSEEDGTWDLF